MGRDKATLPFRGRPLVEIAVEKLRSFCADVAIAGNREDLQHFAPVVRESRREAGPIAGIEAGLRACAFPFALFVPVDVPLVPAALLADWIRHILKRENGRIRLSFLRTGGVRQPAFCLLHRECAGALSSAIDCGDLKLGKVFKRVADELGPGTMWVADAEIFAPINENGPALDLEACFANLNTPDDLLVLESALTAAHVADDILA